MKTKQKILQFLCPLSRNSNTESSMYYCVHGENERGRDKEQELTRKNNIEQTEVKGERIRNLERQRKGERERWETGEEKEVIHTQMYTYST